MTTFEQGVVGYGNKLTLTLANGWKLIFGHVAQGSNGPVAAGARIGTTGANIGSSKGSVTLVEVHNPSGAAVNPHTIMDPIFAGTATVTSLFGKATAQLFGLASKSVVAPGSQGASAPASGPNLGAAWNTLIADLQAAPSEAAKNNASIVAQATNQVTAAVKPVGDFFSTVGGMLQPKHLWTGFFVTLGGVMVLVGVLMYFKGGEIVQAAHNTAKEGAEVAAVAA